MKLNLGCGSKILDGFTNIDTRPLSGVVVDDVKTLNMFEDESADLIYACHVLEHVGRHDRANVLDRWLEILKPKGVLRVAVPDFEKVVQLYRDGVSLENLIGFLYGGQSYESNFHYYCWDFKSLELDLVRSGFSNVVRYEWKDTEHADIDDYSQSYWPHMEKDTGILMSLNVEAIK